MSDFCDQQKPWVVKAALAVTEIWIDLYPLTRFLAKHTQVAVKVERTKELVQTNGILDPAVG